MTKSLNRPLQKILVAALALLLVFAQTAALATPEQQEVGITLNYTRADGTPMSEMAMPVPYPGYENAFWLYVSPEAQMAQDASLTVNDVFARYPGGFSILPGTPVSDYYLYDAQNSLDGPFVEFFGLNEQMQNAATFRLFLSLMAPEPPQPQPTEPTVNPVDITIHYVDQNQVEFANETRTLQPGQTTVTPDASRVPGNYSLTGVGEVVVTVNEYGADQSDVYFYYQAQISPVGIRVHLLKDDNTEFDSYTVTAQPGQNTITPDFGRVPGNYSLTSAGEVVVTVTEQGADQTDVYFTFQAQISPVDIRVHLLKDDNTEFDSYTVTAQPGQNTITPDFGRVPGNYSLTSAGEVVVTVTEQGADQTDVYFTFQVQISPVDITIHYLDQAGTEFSTETRTLQPGANTVTPDAARVPEGYTLTSQGEFTVQVTEQGADQSSVTFTYQTPPVVTDAPTEEPIQPANVPVHFRDELGQPVAPSITITVQPGTQDVYAQPEGLQEGYTLTGPDVQSVTVDKNGATPHEIIFIYKAPAPTTEPTTEPTEEPIQPANVPVHFRDELGQPVAPSITVTVQPGTQDVYAQPEGLQEGYTLTGPDVQSVTVDKNGATPHEIIFIYKAPAPTTEPTTEPTEEPIQPVQITVNYVDDKGNPVADKQLITLPAGTTTVTPTPANLLPGHQLSGQPAYDITVTREGATQTVVNFVYSLVSPVSQPVNVTVSYVDEQGVRIAQDAVFTLGEGKHPIQASPVGIPEGYALVQGEDAIKYVTVTNNKADPASLTFIYAKVQVVTATPAPAPKAALVNVLYKNEAGDVLFSTTAPCKEGEETIISVDYSRVNSSVYQLISEPSFTVTVDAAGNPSMRDVVFLFKDITVKTADLILHYRDEQGATLSPSQTVTLISGTHQVPATPASLPQGYVLVGQSPVEVTVSQSGALSVSELVFTYRIPATATPVVTATPEATVLPFDVTTMDRYAYPTGETINFRSSPDSASKDNVLSVLSQKDLVHILGMVKNKQGEEWYLADVKGQEGFLRATVVRLLEFNEVAALFNWTPTPSPQVQTTDKPFTDGEVIDRWGEVTTTGGVNFRAKAATSSTRISTLERGERFWVYAQETVGNEVWYKIMANGKTGYVVASYTRLYSDQESRQYQATLASPMPYSSTPTPTIPPVTDTPPTQTAQVTTAPTPSPTPAAYHGPALTIRQTALRTGVSRQDEPVMEMLDVNALVQVWSQTWIGEEGWSQVQVMADKQVGYVPTASLRYIDEQEAAFYLAQLQPAATQTPSPTRQPDQRTGYSISRGENVPVRAFPDTNAQIITLLPEGAVVGVRGQEYVAGATWDVIQYGIHFGYVRSDQLRMMDTAEEQNYLNSLRTPTPAPAFTPEPVTLNSPSSYGYVNADRVRLRADASTSSRELKLMSKNAFALVYGSMVQPDGTWYHISQDGTVGYIHGDFFSVLPMGELSTYLQSPEYLNANSASIPVAGGYQQPSQITPLENYNASVWQNPSLISASYEPFNPLGSPTPAVEAIITPSPSPSLTPSPTLLTVEAFEEPPVKPDSGFPTGILAVGLIALLGGGGYYAYHLYNQNQKRAAARAAQRRAQAAQQAGQPQARPAQPSPYTPPRPGTPGAPQGTTQFRPGFPPTPAQGQPGQPPVSQGTTQYRPGTPPTQGQPGQPPVSQGTTQYRPGTPPTQGQAGQPPVSQGTVQYRPGTSPPAQGQAAQPPVPQGTTQFKPLGTTHVQPLPPQTSPQAGAQAPKPAQPGSAPSSQSTQAYQPQRPATQPEPQVQPQEQGSQTPEQRRRRTDRHDNG